MTPSPRPHDSIENGWTRRIVGTWLTKRPDPDALMVALISTLAMMLISVWVWFGQHDLDSDLESWTIASKDLVFHQHQYWRLWTAAVTHSGLGHLLSNSFLFFILGYFLRGYFGLLMFPGLALLLGGVINGLAIATYPAQQQLLGASGIVYWMGGVWLVLYLLIDRRRSWGSRWLRVFGVALMLFLPSEAFDPSISYRTHFIGFGIGVLTGLIYFALHARELRSGEIVELIPPEPVFEIEAQANDERGGTDIQ